MVKEIMTKNGYKVLVDDEDYEKLLNFSIRTTVRNGRVETVQITAQLGRFLINCPRSLVVDHTNRNPLDNRKQNLCVVNRAGNNQNRRKISQNGKRPTSKYKGVGKFEARGHWRCFWRENGKGHIKDCKNEINAALYYDMKMLEIYGPTAGTNFLQTIKNTPAPSGYRHDDHVFIGMFLNRIMPLP